MKFALKLGEKVHDAIVTRVDGRYAVVLDGTEHLVDARKLEADFYSFLYEGKSYEVAVESSGARYVVRHGASEQVVELADDARSGRDEIHRRAGPTDVASIMPGKVVRVLVGEGDEVRKGQGLVVVEAMKMENEIEAPRAGRVRAVPVTPGITVESGATLVVLD
ncbi:MAG TPA: biotin/lipoyl-containing protein [Candidatus Polarisedimenticolaceae bacterium]|nr:biotin/lipoyl-containing protein [Candidatus Polarisedimenticolaceae bacterium]